MEAESPAMGAMASAPRRTRYGLGLCGLLFAVVGLALADRAAAHRGSPPNPRPIARRDQSFRMRLPRPERSSWTGCSRRPAGKRR